MGGDTVLRRLVHLKGADLDLKGLAGTADECGVKGAVHICLGHGNVVLEPPGDGLIHLMDHPQGRIAVLHRLHDDTHCKQIVDLVQSLVLVLHLFIDAEKMLDPAVHLSADTGIFNVVADFVHNALDIFLPDAFAHGNLIHQVIVDFRFKIF